MSDRFAASYLAEAIEIVAKSEPDLRPRSENSRYNIAERLLEDYPDEIDVDENGDVHFESRELDLVTVLAALKEDAPFLFAR
jgi:hypothetical protein